jgi:hypothetical protein
LPEDTVIKPVIRSRVTQTEGLIIDYVPFRSMTGFHLSKSFHRAIVGPRGSGKSSGCLLEKFLIGSRNFPRIAHTRFVIIRRVYRELKDSTQKTFFEIFPPDNVNVVYRKTEETAYVYIQGEGPPVGRKTGAGTRPGVCEFVFRAAEKEEDYGKFLSTEFTGAMIDEAVQLPRVLRDNLVGSIRYPLGFPAEDFHIDLTTNPPDSEEHWIWQCFYEESRKKLENHALFINPAFENTALLEKDPDYYTRLLESMPPDMARIYVYGLVGYIAKGEPFYPWFLKSRHEFDKGAKDYDLSPYGVMLRGWDFGQTKGVCVFVYEDEYGNWDILDEIMVQGLRNSTQILCEKVLAHTIQRYKGLVFHDYADIAGKYLSSSAGMTDMEILNTYGVVPNSCQSTYHDRRNIMYALLTQNDPETLRPRLRVDKSCVNIIRGFLGGYRHAKAKESIVTKPLRPVKDGNYDHYFNCIEYIATNRFPSMQEVLVPRKHRLTADRYAIDDFDEEGTTNIWGYMGV